MKTDLRIAVRSLVEYVLRSGDLSLDFTGTSRTVDAIKAHQKIQKSRPENYAGEVQVSHQVETDRFILNIGGRIDGVFCFPDMDNLERAIVDEIKTKAGDPDYFDSDAFEENENSLHWGQAKVYAYIFAKDHGLDHIDVQLTYYHLDTRKKREFKKKFSFHDLETFFQDLVSRYLAWAEKIAQWNRTRDASIIETRFPFHDFRPGQRHMAEQVYRTIRDQGQYIVQAATGIGKTMAAIFPAIKALGLGLGSKIFYLTARTTGRMAAETALSRLRADGLRFKSVTITAKDKICFNPDHACNGEECEFARGHFDRVGNALDAVFELDAITREEITEAALKHKVCPFELSLETCLWADMVVCDYNYAFDPRVYLRRFFMEDIGDYVFLLDEAHNLVDRSREMFSSGIRKSAFLELRRAVKNDLTRMYKILGKINSWFLKTRKRCEDADGRFAEKTQPEDIYPLLKSFLSMAEHWLVLNIKTNFRQQLLDLYFEATGFMRVADQYDAAYSTCYEREKKEIRVRLFCLDPSVQMNECLKRCKSAVFFSATMTPTHYFKTLFGCGKSALEEIIPSPFPPEHLGLFTADTISTYYRDRQHTAPQVGRIITAMVSRKKGNYLLFFPSYQYMNMVHSEVASGGLADTRILVQTPSMTETEREEFLETFKKDNPDTLVGFAVMGGIFGEGIDLVGDRLSGAAIVGVGLPGISPERELIREHFNQQGGPGFEYAYMFPGINRVLQAAGRVIRSETDRGTVLLIDKRYATFRYRSLLPPQWQPERVFNNGRLEKQLDSFWNESPPPDCAKSNTPSNNETASSP